jgi:hypothetical protein
MSTVTKKRTETSTEVPPFGVQIDHPRNSDVIVQAIPGCRLRSTIKSTRQVKNKITGEMVVPVDQAMALATLPEIPGMVLHVNPTECSYVVIDPLEGDESFCERIENWMRVQSGYSGKMRGCPPLKGTLDVHRMKTLCREITWWLTDEWATVVKGLRPKIEDVDGLPGKYLLNPGSSVPNLQPEFEEDWDVWRASLATMGG